MPSLRDLGRVALKPGSAARPCDRARQPPWPRVIGRPEVSVSSYSLPAAENVEAAGVLVLVDLPDRKAALQNGLG